MQTAGQARNTLRTRLAVWSTAVLTYLSELLFHINIYINSIAERQGGGWSKGTTARWICRDTKKPEAGVLLQQQEKYIRFMYIYIGTTSTQCSVGGSNNINMFDTRNVAQTLLLSFNADRS